MAAATSIKPSEIVLCRQAPEQAHQQALDQPSIGGKLPTITPLTPHGRFSRVVHESAFLPATVLTT
jgi:hypothetical protein